MDAEQIVTQGGVSPSPDSEMALRSMILPGEAIVHLAVISDGIYWKGIAMLVIGLATMVLSFILGVYLIAVSGVILIVEYMTQKYLLLAATDRRVIVRTGIIDLQVIDLPFSRVESVELIVPPVGRLLGYAGVIISGTGHSSILVPFVGDAAAFRNALVRLMAARDGAPSDLPPPDVQHAA